MQIKDEWRRKAREAWLWEGQIDDVLNVVAPLIAADVIEACAREVVGNGYNTSRLALAMEIRREVPKMFGESDAD